MKIVSCFVSRGEIGPLAEAGADELYTSAGGLPSFTEAGLRRPADLKAAFRDIHALGKKASVAVNSLQVAGSPQEMRKLADGILRLEDYGADAFIVANPALLALLAAGRRLRAELHLSSIQPCFNTAALRFFLRFGVKRLILPSQLAPREAGELLRLCRARGVGTEIFDYRFFGCVYVNGRCSLHTQNFHTFRRGDGGALCRCGGRGEPLPARPLGVEPALAREAAAAARRVGTRLAGGGAPRLYNAATFYDFFALGAGWLKYGVRQDPAAEKARKVRALRDMISLAGGLTERLGRAAARAEFIRRMTARSGA